MTAVNIPHDVLADYTRRLFQLAGSEREEAGLIAGHLVEANLKGHDSHGIVRGLDYLQRVEEGLIVPNQHAKVVERKGSFVAVDGGFGYGQVIGHEAVELGIELSREHPVAVVAVRNSTHLGRIGHWAEQAAEAGLVSMMFVNTSGKGIVVAPHGGSDRRLSANPIAAGVPVTGGDPIILDFSTSIVAGGKIIVAKERGEALPPGVLLDADGNPTTDPSHFFSETPGALLPFGGHKGYGLLMLADILSGGLSGGGMALPDNPTAGRLVNNMLMILINPADLESAEAMQDQLARYRSWVLGSRPVDPEDPVRLPGQGANARRAQRMRDGIPIAAATLSRLIEAAERLGMSAEHRGRLHAR